MNLEAETVTAAEIAAALPEPVGLQSLAGTAFGLGIFPLGFEERTSACAEALVSAHVSFAEIIVLTYPTNEGDNERRLGPLLASLEKLCSAPIRQMLFEPSVLQTLAVHEVSELPTFFDISPASNSLLLDVVWWLLARKNGFTIGYAAAEEYFPTRTDVLTPTGALRKNARARELASGTADLHVDVRHSGRFSESGQDLVVMIPGFDNDRTRKVISSVDPSLLSRDQERVHWILGNPLLEVDNWRRAYQEKLHQDSGCGAVAASLHSCSTFRYQETISLLEEIFDQVPETARITLSPMGSKMQALGCALFCTARPEVRVTFAVPVTYNASHYSRGSRPPVALTFDSSIRLRESLESIGELRVRVGDRIVFAGTRRLW